MCLCELGRLGDQEYSPPGLAERLPTNVLGLTRAQRFPSKKSPRFWAKTLTEVNYQRGKKPESCSLLVCVSNTAQPLYPNQGQWQTRF